MPLDRHSVVTESEWLEARKAHLAKEKELTRLRDELLRERRALPWTKVEKPYEFEGPSGVVTLAELFDGRSQLIVYHFMFGPGWAEGCPGCSFISDHFDGPNLHLKHHDVTLVAVSRAPFREFQAFKKRMGWKFPWVSSFGSDFNFDFHVSFTPEEVASGRVAYNYSSDFPAHDELHGTSVFYRNEQGEVFHTYSSYGRGSDILLGAHNLLDLTPKGRNERETMDWMRHHDRYDEVKRDASCCCATDTK
ncbi:MAG: thioredoxin family protein [Bdellovibrionota bacterium]